MQVLSVMGTVVNKLKMHMTPTIPKIFDAVFECTLEMINKDFEVFPEHRTNFFFLLQVITIQLCSFRRSVYPSVRPFLRPYVYLYVRQSVIRNKVLLTCNYSIKNSIVMLCRSVGRDFVV